MLAAADGTRRLCRRRPARLRQPHHPQAQQHLPHRLRPQPDAAGQGRPVRAEGPEDRRDGQQRRRSREAALRDSPPGQAGRSGAATCRRADAMAATRPASHRGTCGERRATARAIRPAPAPDRRSRPAWSTRPRAIGIEAVRRLELGGRRRRFADALPARDPAHRSCSRREEEYRTACAARGGDFAARQSMIEHNLRPGGQHRQGLPGARRADGGPDRGRQPRPDARDQQVRARTRLPLFDLCHVVDPPVASSARP